MKRRIEVILETDRFLYFRGGASRPAVWCERCESDLRMVPPEAAALVCRQNTRAIYRGVEAGRVHFTETSEGSLLVCLDSVRAARGE